MTDSRYPYRVYRKKDSVLIALKESYTDAKKLQQKQSNPEDFEIRYGDVK